MSLVSYHKSYVAVIGRVFRKNETFKMRFITGEEKAGRFKPQKNRITDEQMNRLTD